jgi:hypothetical protein
MNGYIVFYKNKRWEVYASDVMTAKQKAIAHYRVPANREHLVSVYLAEKEGKPVEHTPDF